MYICDFHREQAWQRWAKTSKNGLTVGEKALFLEIMQQIASARNVESYRKSVESLQKSKLYTGNPNIAEYGEKCG